MDDGCDRSGRPPEGVEERADALSVTDALGEREGCGRADPRQPGKAKRKTVGMASQDAPALLRRRPPTANNRTMAIRARAALAPRSASSAPKPASAGRVARACVTRMSRLDHS